jgi:hypothetical protein
MGKPVLFRGNRKAADKEPDRQNGEKKRNGEDRIGAAGESLRPPKTFFGKREGGEEPGAEPETKGEESGAVTIVCEDVKR